MDTHIFFFFLKPGGEGNPDVHWKVMHNQLINLRTSLQLAFCLFWRICPGLPQITRLRFQLFRVLKIKCFFLPTCSQHCGNSSDSTRVGPTCSAKAMQPVRIICLQTRWVGLVQKAKERKDAKLLKQVIVFSIGVVCSSFLRFYLETSMVFSRKQLSLN